MGLAPFFQKAALAGSHLLQDFDVDNFGRILLANTVQIAFDAEAVASSEGRVTLELAVNLLSRLYPRLSLIPLQGVEEASAELATLARSINPDIEILSGAGSATLCLVVGSTSIAHDGPTFYIGSDGWIAGFSPDCPVGSGNSSNPFGAAAAACFGVANLFRATFASQLGGAKTDTAFRVSLLDLDERNELSNPLPSRVDIGESHLVGVGAIGNAAVWALARFPLAEGILHLVDDEEIDDTNLQRYVLANTSDIGKSKVALAQDALRNSALRVERHALAWGRYLEDRNDWHFERVAVALDTPEDRCLVQAALPQWIVNAWTQPEDLGVSRHNFGVQACLMCLYMPDGAVPDLDDQIVSALHLPDDLQTLRDVRSLLVNGAHIGAGWVERIAAANEVSPERLMNLKDLPMRSFYQRAICGGIMLSLGASTDRAPRNAEVPMAFQSALAGILLAAELIAHAAKLKKSPPPVTTKVNLLKPLGAELSLPAPQHPSGKCICQDDDYIAVHRDKYQDTS